MRKQALLLLALGMAISGSACTGGNSGGPSAPVPVPPRVELGIVYASPDGVPLKLDAYLPGSPGPHPGVILIHGGAFRTGGRGWETYLATALVDAGFAAFSVDYRLAPEFPFPAAVDDVLAAVAWVRAHAAEYGVDSREIGAIGESAGGHLAAMLAVLGRDPLDTGSRIAAAVSWSGPMDLHALVRDAGDVVTGGLTIRDDVVEPFLGCRGVSCARLFRERIAGHVRRPFRCADAPGELGGRVRPDRAGEGDGGRTASGGGVGPGHRDAGRQARRGVRERPRRRCTQAPSSMSRSRSFAQSCDRGARPAAGRGQCRYQGRGIRTRAPSSLQSWHCISL